MKKYVVLLVAVFSLTACNKQESETVETTVSSSEETKITTESLQNDFNNLVDDQLKFMETIGKISGENASEEIVTLAEKETSKCDELINKIETGVNDELTIDLQKEILSLAKSNRQYYSYTIDGKVDEATSEALIGLSSVKQIAEKYFYGEMPPYYVSISESSD